MATHRLVDTAATTIIMTVLAMLAFAANSVLTRLALGSQLIDAATFASVRVVSGAIVLVLIVAPRWRRAGWIKADWRAVLMLFAYVACFSFAYLSLSAGTGALILFGCVQLTMFTAALRAGEAFSRLSWVGLAVALLGLVGLVFPGLTAPEPLGAALMAVAGVGWGIYSLLGRGSTDALSATANNFLLCVPLVLLVSVLFAGEAHVTGEGLALAVLSGVVASGLGYVIWFAALPRLATTTAATVQLSVPAIAALAGVVFINEGLTVRLVLASIATLGGVWIVLAQRNP
ncbi:MAG: DMT family transporter [Gammaproteobacteria bacterium]|nr:DMT family transporter [Gammaproteobacteria bacterium]